MNLKIKQLEPLLYIFGAVGIIDMGVQAMTRGDIRIIQSTLTLIFG